MMKTNHGFGYAYNAQAAADEFSQVVLAAYVTQAPTDVNQLLVMLERIDLGLAAAGLGQPKRTLADAGYCSTANIDAAADSSHDVLVATGRLKHHEQVPDAPRGPIPKNTTSRQRMARRLRTKKGRADYARRKAIIEPVFGQMKVKQNAGQLRLRGLAGAQASSPSTPSVTTSASSPTPPNPSPAEPGPPQNHREQCSTTSPADNRRPSTCTRHRPRPPQPIQTHAPSSRDKHAGHDPEVFRRLFWWNLVLVVPVLVFSDQIQEWFDYSIDGAWAAWVAPLAGTVVYLWGGKPFLARGSG